MDTSNTQFLKQVKRHVDGDVSVCRATWHRVLQIALDLAAERQRFMVSPDGMNCDWVASPAVRPQWIDCTDMPDEEFQTFVANLQAQPRIVSLGVAA